jgi:hypothetical protein
MRYTVYLLLTVAAVLVLVAPVGAGHLGEKSGHYEFSGVIYKIESGLLFVETTTGLRPRWISQNRADRAGLHEAKIGDAINMLVDSGNQLMDAALAGRPFGEHRMVAGTLHYADPFWGEIQLSTPKGFERFDVDTLAGSKLSVFQEGAPVTIELDADNVMVDIQSQR